MSRCRNERKAAESIDIDRRTTLSERFRSFSPFDMQTISPFFGPRRPGGRVDSSSSLPPSSLGVSTE